MTIIRWEATPMAKDGTNRGRRRVRAGAKPIPTFEKITEGKDARIIDVTPLHPIDLEPDADLEDSEMPEPSSYLAYAAFLANPHR